VIDRDEALAMLRGESLPPDLARRAGGGTA